MTVKEWEAQRVRTIVSTGNTQPSLKEIILSIIPDNGFIKREEIIHCVSVTTGIDKLDLQKHISNSLSTLCRTNKLIHGKTAGFYCK